MNRYLVVMTKEPVAGRVKTRLARSIGVVAATRFARINTQTLLRRVDGDPRWTTLLSIAPDISIESHRWPLSVPRLAQGPGDLGQRMQRVFDVLPPGPAIIVGTDIPDIRARHIAQAFALLGSHDAVFGPASDGGYWLIGLRRRPRIPRPFADVRWSGPHALSDTIANLNGSRIAEIDTLSDVDTPDAYFAWRRREG